MEDSVSPDLEGIPAEGELVDGKFRIEKLLGMGGMGVVLSARHVHLGHLVAIKFLNRRAAKLAEATTRFLREARAAVGLHSPHVVRVMDAGTHASGLPYMVMEHLAGVDLSDLLRERTVLPATEAVDYVLQACEALAEAHAAGIVHRDLKPGNLFLGRRPDGAPLVKVLDFGISKAMEGNALMASEASLTATSSIMGSPLYMSPEQLRSSKNVDLRTDIWSLGVILYQLIAGEPPFEADTVTGLCAKIVADQPPTLRARSPEISEALDRVVMRCLDKDVTRRFQSVGELALALRPFASVDGQLSVDRVARMTGLAAGVQSSGQFPSAATPEPSLAGAKGATAQMTPMTAPATQGADTVSAWQSADLAGRRKMTLLLAGGGTVVAVAAGAILALVLTRPHERATSAAGSPPSTTAVIAQPVEPPPLPALTPLAESATPPAASSSVGGASSAPLASASPPPKKNTAQPRPLPAKSRSDDASLLNDRK